LSGYEGYGQLLRRVGDERHQSCLVQPVGRSRLTARKAKLAGALAATEWFTVEAQEILKAKGLVSKEDESRHLIEYYAGNPLA